jgi:hypothetical protein
MPEWKPPENPRWEWQNSGTLCLLTDEGTPSVLAEVHISGYRWCGDTCSPLYNRVR